MEREEKVVTKQSGGSSNAIAIIALILAVLVGIGLIILYFIYFFRRSPTGYTVWTTVNVSGDVGNATTATITPNINYVYILASGITSVVLNTPTVSNYAGTTFIIKVSDIGVPVNVTPPPGVTLNLVSKLPSGASATFLWSNNGTILYVLA